jgi:DNA-binding MarR family transcriptional regulator
LAGVPEQTESLAAAQEAAPAGSCGDDETDPLSAQAARFAAMPVFEAALRAYITGVTGFRRSNRLINKLVSYHARFRLAGYLLYLHADRERFGHDGGATYGNLLAMCNRPPEISPRVLKTMLALLQFTGMVKAKRDSGDRRSKIYQPTPRMQSFTQPWLHYATSALDILEPEMRRARMWQDDPGFVDRFLVSSGRAHETAKPLVERMPEWVAFFGMRDGAIAVTLPVMRADIDGTVVPSRAEIAKTFGLSKTQVTKVLQIGETQGYFALDAAGIPAATEHLRTTFRQWVSTELAFYAQHMRPAAAPQPRSPRSESKT